MKSSRFELWVMLTLMTLSAIIAALWVRSGYDSDALRICDADRWYYIDSSINGLQFGTFPRAEFDPKPSFYMRFTPATFQMAWNSYTTVADQYYHLAGFQYLRGVPWIRSYWTVCVPFWFLLLATSIPGLILFRARRRRAARGGDATCAKCGYDLRATPNRCPECGAVPTERIHVPRL